MNTKFSSWKLMRGYSIAWKISGSLRKNAGSLNFQSWTNLLSSVSWQTRKRFLSWKILNWRKRSKVLRTFWGLIRATFRRLPVDGHESVLSGWARKRSKVLRTFWGLPENCLLKCKQNYILCFLSVFKIWLLKTVAFLPRF